MSHIQYTICRSGTYYYNRRLPKQAIAAYGSFIRHALSCTLSSSMHGELKMSGGCNRIGILTTTTNKMHDLVCNRSDILKWDVGKLQYAWQNKN